MTRTPLAAIGAALAIAVLALAPPAAAQIEPFNAPGVSGSLGASAWWSWGTSTWEHDIFGLGLAGSKLDWQDVESPVATLGGELAWRFLVVSGAVGWGPVLDGTFIDDDFLLGTLFSRTRSTVDDGEIVTLNADVGVRALRWRDGEGQRGHLDVLLGYYYWREEYEAFGAVPLVGPISIPAGVKVITHEWEWHGARVGARVDAPVWKRLRYRLALFFLPWSSLRVRDTHHLRDDLAQNPSIATEATGGFGFQIEGGLTYRIVHGLSVEVGLRYWQVAMDEGRVTFRHADGTRTVHRLVEASADRYGPYAGLTYRFP